MRLALLIVGYLLLHIGSYLAVFRWRQVSRTEGGIFAYHVVSFGLLVVAAVAAGSLGLVPLGPSLLLVVGLHGTYSLSFLELWSLSQGGYSLAMLSAVDRAGGLGAEQFERMSEVGAVKRAVRTDLLRRLGLGSGGEASFRPSQRGRAVAAVLAGIIWLTRGRTLN